MYSDIQMFAPFKDKKNTWFKFPSLQLPFGSCIKFLMFCLCADSLLNAGIRQPMLRCRPLLSMLRHILKIRINALMCILRKDFMIYLLTEWLWWDLLLSLPTVHSFLRITEYCRLASWQKACWVLPFNKIEYTV